MLVTYGLLEETWSAKVANFERSNSGVRTSQKHSSSHFAFAASPLGRAESLGSQTQLIRNVDEFFSVLLLKLKHSQTSNLEEKIFIHH